MSSMLPYYTGPIKPGASQSNGNKNGNTKRANKPARVKRPTTKIRASATKKPSRWVWMLDTLSTLALFIGDMGALVSALAMLLRPDLFAPSLTALIAGVSLLLYGALRVAYRSRVSSATFSS